MQEAQSPRGAFLVLLALRDGPKHGYEIAAHLKERSGGVFGLSFGALYPILHRLEKDGLVSGSWQEVGPAKKKKVYALTRKGEAALGAEKARYLAFAGALSKLLREA
ncbi:MAG TPA: PadR family transcriptional regulator [Anaeromyxobacteraceae bacterium]|nr:PadR family transcriptional regulator [Anaeromyxobacteraceae bacterium]